MLNSQKPNISRKRDQEGYLIYEEYTSHQYYETVLLMKLSRNLYLVRADMALLCLCCLFPLCLHDWAHIYLESQKILLEKHGN